MGRSSDHRYITAKLDERRAQGAEWRRQVPLSAQAEWKPPANRADPVEIDGKPFTVDQTNNAYVFPGVGLGVLAVRAQRVSDDMFAAAAKALAGVSPASRDPRANLLPPVHDLRKVAVIVAAAVARQARAEGLCEAFDDAALDGLIAQKMWEPVYRSYHRKGANPHGQIL